MKVQLDDRFVIDSEENKIRFLETIYGNLATVYLKSKRDNLDSILMQKSFYGNEHSTMGSGFYAVYEVDDLKKVDARKFGGYIFKCVVPVGKMLILDYDEYIKSPVYRIVGGLETDFEYVFNQLSYFNIKITDNLEKLVFKAYEMNGTTASIAKVIYEMVPFTKKVIDGMVYATKEFGSTIVCYPPTKVQVIGKSVDGGKTFEKVDVDKDYLSLVMNNKIAPSDYEFTGVLYRPEDFGITDYEFVGRRLNVFKINGKIGFSDKKLDKVPYEFGSMFFGSFNISKNNIESLNGCPDKVTGYFDCSFNPLLSLKGCPKEIGGEFFAVGCGLRSLEHFPEKINYSIDVSFNKLKSLKGLPEAVNGDLILSGNNLTNLKGLPILIAGDLFIDRKIGYSVSEIRKLSEVRGEVILT